MNFASYCSLVIVLSTVLTFLELVGSNRNSAVRTGSHSSGLKLPANFGRHLTLRGGSNHKDETNIVHVLDEKAKAPITSLPSKSHSASTPTTNFPNTTLYRFDVLDQRWERVAEGDLSITSCSEAPITMAALRMHTRPPFASLILDQAPHPTPPLLSTIPLHTAPARSNAEQRAPRDAHPRVFAPPPVPRRAARSQGPARAPRPAPPRPDA